MKGLVSALVVLAFVATACKASREGGPWAGIDSYEAGNAASDIVGKEEKRPASPLFRKELAVAGIERGEDPLTNEDAWVITLQTFDNVTSSKCLFLWGNHTPFTTHVQYDVGDCPGGGGT